MGVAAGVEPNADAMNAWHVQALFVPLAVKPFLVALDRGRFDAARHGGPGDALSLLWHRAISLAALTCVHRRFPFVLRWSLFPLSAWPLPKIKHDDEQKG